VLHYKKYISFKIKQNNLSNSSCHECGCAEHVMRPSGSAASLMVVKNQLIKDCYTVLHLTWQVTLYAQWHSWNSLFGSAEFYSHN
jgi:hypothetical protein